MCSANTIEKTHGRSSKPLSSTVNDRLLTFEQLLWCDWRQMDRGTPTCLLRFNLCSPCSKTDILNVMIPFSNSGGRLLINMASLRSYLVFEFGVDMFDLVLQETHGKTTYSRKPASHLKSIRYTLHSFHILSAFYWIHFQTAVSWTLLWNPPARFPVLHTILTKHQAFAPSGPISFARKFRFIKVEFSLRPSAKAWQEKSGPRVQLFNWSNSRSSHSSLPSREFLRLLNQGMRDETRLIRHEVRVMDGFGMQHVSF